MMPLSSVDNGLKGEYSDLQGGGAVLLLTLSLFMVQAPLPAAALTPAGVRCSQTPGMVLVEGICVSAAENVVVDGTFSAPSPAPTPPPATKRQKRSPRVSLTCYPKMQIGSIRPVSVAASVRVMDPNDTYWCPGISWTINGEPAGNHEGDCRPYEDIVAETGEPQVWSEDQPKRFQFWSGSYVITAKLIKAGKLIAQETCTVHVK